MAAGATFYRDSGMTQAVSDGLWAGSELPMGTVNIPASGDAYTTPVQVWLKNTGTTTLQSIAISAVAGSGQTDTPYDDRVEFAPDNAGSPGTWDTTEPFNVANLNAGSSVSFWVRLRANASDTQPVNPVKFSLRLDATSV